MQTLNVSHRSGSYDIVFHSLAGALQSLPEDRAFITDENVYRHYGHAIVAERAIVLPPGEHSKSLDQFGRCLERLAQWKLKRTSCIVAFGGGVIGDLGGFVASAYMRGVAYIQIPSTLLAQVDSSVGGKVAVDLEAGKNMAGAFYPPTKVYVCPELLQTLDRRQFNNGMAEVWKYAFIADSGLCKSLVAGASQKHEGLHELILACLKIKSDLVVHDEFEEKGIRAILNFGHTVGHAIEKVTGYSEVLHGEAISIGMCVEARIGEKLGVTKAGVSLQVESCLAGQGLPTKMSPSWTCDSILDAMMSDKKRTPSGFALSLLTEIGQCKLVEGISAQDLEKLLRDL